MKIRQYSNIPILRPEIVWDKDIWQNSMIFVCLKSDCWPKNKNKATFAQHRCALYWSPLSARKIDRVLEIVFWCLYLYCVCKCVCLWDVSVIAVYKIFICVWAILKSHLNLHAEVLECHIKSDLWKYPTEIRLFLKSATAWKVFRRWPSKMRLNQKAF